jgi:hypothetical protein
MMRESIGWFMPSEGRTLTAWIAILLFLIGLIIGLVVTIGTTIWLVLALPPPPPFPAEPVLGLGLLCLALGGLLVLLKK